MEEICIRLSLEQVTKNIKFQVLQTLSNAGNSLIKNVTNLSQISRKLEIGEHMATSTNGEHWPSQVSVITQNQS